MMPRISSYELLQQLSVFVEAKHLFVYVYDSEDQLAYQIADLINEQYVKLLEQYTSDSIQIFKSSEEQIIGMAENLPAVIYLNPTGENKLFYLEGQTTNSLMQFVHECIVQNNKQDQDFKKVFVSPYLSREES